MDSKYANLLDSGSGNVVQSFFDNYLKSNADFRNSAGFRMTVIRESVGACCAWCQDLVGVYDYDNRPSDIYARHQNCNCIVVTKTERGTYQDAWSRKEYDTYRDARIARAEEIIGDQNEKEDIGLINRKKQQNAFRRYANDIRNDKPLTPEQKEECRKFAEFLGMPKERIQFSDTNQTVYGDVFDWLVIGTDVYPRKGGSKKANGKMSYKGALAHEIVGHRETTMKGTNKEPCSPLDEAQASFRAARFAPGLSNKDRFWLIRDGLDRLHNAGLNLTQVKSQLDIFIR